MSSAENTRNRIRKPREGFVVSDNITNIVLGVVEYRV